MRPQTGRLSISNSASTPVTILLSSSTTSCPFLTEMNVLPSGEKYWHLEHSSPFASWKNPWDNEFCKVHIFWEGQKEKKLQNFCFRFDWHYSLNHLLSTHLKLEISTLYDPLFTFFRRVEISSFRRVERKKKRKADDSNLYVSNLHNTLGFCDIIILTCFHWFDDFFSRKRIQLSDF